MAGFLLLGGRSSLGLTLLRTVFLSQLLTVSVQEVVK